MAKKTKKQEEAERRKAQDEKEAAHMKHCMECFERWLDEKKILDALSAQH